MEKFAYKARDRRGELSTGVIAASDLNEAGRLLCAQNKFIVHLAPANERDAIRTGQGGAGVKRTEVINYVNQLAMMVDTGVSLGEALALLTRHTSSKPFRATLEKVTAEVQAGAALSQALNQHPRAFPPIMTALIRASEASGTMSQMLERIGAYLTKEYQTVRQVRGALIYPAALFTLCIGVTIFLLAFVMPRFVVIYKNKGAALPAPTRLLMFLSNGLVNHWLAVIITTLAIIIAIILWARTGVGRRQTDWLKLNVPIFSGIFRKLYLSRACRTIGTMIDSGVSLLETIDIARDVTRNHYYDKLWNQTVENVRQGQQLSDSLFKSPLIPESVAQMVHSGETSGRLGQVFNRLADFSEHEFDQAVKNATQFIEPMMIVLMGSIIGFVAIALLVPIFSIGKVMGAGN